MQISDLMNNNGNTQKNVFIARLNDGTDLLVHYGTPVAAFHKDLGWIKTEKHWSTVTSKNINLFLPNKNNVTEVTQAFLDKLLSDV